MYGVFRLQAQPAVARSEAPSLLHLGIIMCSVFSIGLWVRRPVDLYTYTCISVGLHGL